MALSRTVRTRVVLSGLAAAAALTATPAAAASAGVEGWQAYQAQRYEDAVQLWEPAAAAGDVEAQFGLGIALDLGQGVPTDSLAACAWYRRAGAAGLAAAAFNAAVMYDNRRCGPRQVNEAATWYAIAAARGHARAQYNLAQLYAAGDGVPHNPDQATFWFRAAAAGGIAAAMDKLRLAVIRPSSVPATLTPAQPMAPTSAIHPGIHPDSLSVAFVWTAPAQPVPAHFVIEVYSLDGTQRGAEGREAYAGTSDGSATTVPLPAMPGRYAWRVLTVGTASPHYATSTWQRFQIEKEVQP